MEVIQLHKNKEIVKTSKHDITTPDGRHFYFDLSDCNNGGCLCVSYSLKMSLKDHLRTTGIPSFIADNVVDGDREHREIIFEKHIKPKWWQKYFLFQTTERQILKFVRETKKTILNDESRTKALNVLKEIVEKSDV